MRSSRGGEKGQTSSMGAQIRRTQTKREGRPRHPLEVCARVCVFVPRRASVYVLIKAVGVGRNGHVCVCEVFAWRDRRCVR